MTLAILFRSFGFIAPKTLNCLSFQIFDFGHTWWRLFQKRVVRTKCDIYVFIYIYLTRVEHDYSVTNWLFLYWPWYRFSVSSIGPRSYGPRANTGRGPILLTENLYKGQCRNSQFVTLLLNNLTGPYDRAVWIYFQGGMDKLTGPYGYIDRAVWAWFLRH